VHIEDPYAEDTLVDTTIRLDDTSQSPCPPAEFWEEHDSIALDEEFQFESSVPATPAHEEYAITSRLATLHLIKHYKEGPGTW
jgi:hypothetical protein